MSGSKKYEKKFYGYVTENLEDDSPFTIEVIGSLKKCNNKKISDRIKISSNSNTFETLTQHSYKYKTASIKQNNSFTQKGKIIISHHKPKNIKSYFGSKTNKKLYQSKKIYNIIPLFSQYADTKRSSKKKN